MDFVHDDYDVAERRWEGIPIKCVRRGAAMHLSADVVVTTSLAFDVVNWAAAHCEGRYCAMCHDYSGAPWGPFGHVDAKQRAPLRDALAGPNLLCDSKHVTAYHERAGPANVTPRLCYGACYDALLPRAAALPARRRRGVRDASSRPARRREEFSWPPSRRGCPTSSSCAWRRRGRTRWCSTS